MGLGPLEPGPKVVTVYSGLLALPTRLAGVRLIMHSNFTSDIRLHQRSKDAVGCGAEL